MSLFVCLFFFFICFPLSVSSPNNAYQLRNQNNQMPVHIYFTNIAAIQNMGAPQQIRLYEILGGTLLICQKSTMRVYGAWSFFVLFFT